MKKRAVKVVGPDGWLYPEGTTFSDTPRDPSEIATDENLALAALDNQMRAERDKRDPYAMTSDKLAEKLPGMGAASLQLPDGLAQSYDIAKWRLEDEQLLKEAQLTNITKEGDPMADFANVAAAQAAGYAYEAWTSTEGNASFFFARLEKITRGADQGEDDDIFDATSQSSISQADADAKVVASLNAERSERYGFAEAGSTDMTPDGAAEVADAT